MISQLTIRRATPRDTGAVRQLVQALRPAGRGSREQLGHLGPAHSEPAGELAAQHLEQDHIGAKRDWREAAPDHPSIPYVHLELR